MVKHSAKAGHYAKVRSMVRKTWKPYTGSCLTWALEDFTSMNSSEPSEPVVVSHAFPLIVSTPHPIISPVIVQLQNPLAQATRGSLSIRPVPIEYSSRLSKSSMSQCHWAVLTFCKLWIADNMQTLSSRDLIDFLYFPIKTEPHNFGTYLINAVTLLKLSVFSKFSIIPAFFSIWLPFLWICFSNYSPSCLTWHQQSYNRITQNLIQSLGCLATALIPPNLKQPVSWNSMTWCKLWRSLLPSWPCMDQNSPWAIHLHH